jgi:hypothetical protein
MNRSRRLQYLSLCLFLLLAVVPLQASLLQVTEVGLNAADRFQWSSLGGDITPLSPPVALVSQGGRTASLDGSTDFALFSGSTYNADFLPTDTVLSAFDLNTFTSLVTGIRIVFAIPVYGVGAQIQVNAFGAFQGTLELFDSSFVSLGTVQVNSTVQGNGDGSAPFLGALSTDPIKAALFTADSSGVAINDLQVNLVPEPAEIFALLPALALLAIRRKRR